jgi:uncharacterized short protein YbdD (DUF466 family)
MRKFLRLIYDYLNGNFAYQNYVEHQQRSHSDEQVLDKKSFLRDKEKRKWQKINRCC